MPRKEALQGGAISAQAQQDLVSEGIDNFELPKSLVTRIARSALPENVKMQKETVLSLIKGSTVFINYLAATAHDVALSKQHKSISASDVLKALEMIEFGDLVDKLQTELLVYREQAKTDKSKKGSSNVNSHAVKGKTAPVTSTPKSVKGKEKAVILLPPALAPSSSHDPDPADSMTTAHEMAMDVDDEGDVDMDPPIPVDPEAEDEVEQPDGGEDEEADDNEDEPEELIDTVALDVQEMQQDSRGLDDPRADID
ncbi:DNA polymerase epsilon subunit 3 [Favolaschia claudopus]|uniref:DNA polymerase epsilon subunit D n=1 Tax=Favolaschia claudopus TaxID=2862362 RepID=A0AAW0BD06_9AGAR